MIEKNFGNRIKLAREKNNLTRTQFANLLGISNSFLSELENNKANPSKTLILLISEKYSISDEWLESGKGPMAREKVTDDELIPTSIESLAGDDQKIIDIVRILKSDPGAREVIYEILDEDKRASRVANTVKRFLNRRVELSLKFPGLQDNGGEDNSDQ
jgi:transcriptional regulator with XRE-family HTH domain